MTIPTEGFCLRHETQNAKVSWGDASCGGDSSVVQGQLRQVAQVQSADRSFAALRQDGTVVCWGDPSGRVEGTPGLFSNQQLRPAPALKGAEMSNC